jgi:hypothetical protein
MIKDLLVQKRKKLLERWTEEVLDAYPSESGPFLKGERDRFRNPVGHTIAAGLERIYDGLIEDGNRAGAEQAIEDIIRMRTVQQFSPSEAVGFMLPLKELVREAIRSTASETSSRAGTELLGDFADLEMILDRLTLYAVDCYAGCREAVFQASVNEARAGGMMGAAVMRRRTQ